MSVTPFLKILAESLFKEYNTGIQDICIVFPNRRAGLFFRKYLAEIAGIPLCSPSIYTINELMVELSGLRLCDPVDLVIEVYEIYASLISLPEPLDDFYNWGEHILRDFDDLDKSLVHAEGIFRNILDLKQIDTAFDYLSAEQKGTLKKFWGSINEMKVSEHQQKFLSFWKTLHPLYSALKENLRRKGKAYEGMIYREVAGKILKKEYPVLPARKIVLAGFNALTEAEKTLFRYCRDSGTGSFYWDYDIHYLENIQMEAGRFIRENLKEFPPAALLENQSNLGSQRIMVYELPSDIMQAKFLTQLLNTVETAVNEFQDTAVILADENLLIPVLYSLPLETGDINITMGYPLKYSPVYSFLELVMKMQVKVSKYTGKRKNKYYYKHVFPILDHQYSGSFMDSELVVLKNRIRSDNMIYLDEALFQNSEFLRRIFVRIENLSSLIDYLVSLLVYLAKEFSLHGHEFYDKLDKEYVYFLLLRLRKLSLVIRNFQPEIRIETFINLFRKVIRSTTIPFEGEPLGGLQIMGLLETRLLDFRNLIFLSMNEGIIPRTHHSYSYIPYNIRYAFNMPTRDYHDAIYAYYFYRLLQRSESVCLLYNNRTDGINTGEMSRFIYQLQFDSKFNVGFESIGFKIIENPMVPVNIAKTPGIMKKLEKFLAGGTSSLSPSALNTYLDCRLKFYFSRIADLREPEDVTEDIEAREMGTLFHETMHQLYAPFVGRTVARDDIRELLAGDKITQALEKAFRIIFSQTTDNPVEFIPEGKNIIIFEVIKKYAAKILELDMKKTPFQLLVLENPFSAQIKVGTASGEIGISLGGTIDRIDRDGEGYRILDYKTGQADSIFGSVGDLFNPENKNRNSSVFQILLYAWICDQQFIGKEAIFPGLYSTRKIFEEDFSPVIRLKDTAEKFDFRKFRESYADNLRALIGQIFDTGTSFSQTTNPDHCMKCDFAEICHRKSRQRS